MEVGVKLRSEDFDCLHTTYYTSTSKTMMTVYCHGTKICSLKILSVVVIQICSGFLCRKTWTDQRLVLVGAFWKQFKTINFCGVISQCDFQFFCFKDQLSNITTLHHKRQDASKITWDSLKRFLKFRSN